MSKPLKGFITYSHKDAAAKDELRERLAVMEQKNELTIWHDGQITAPGDEWYENISNKSCGVGYTPLPRVSSKSCLQKLQQRVGRGINRGHESHSNHS